MFLIITIKCTQLLQMCHDDHDEESKLSFCLVNSHAKSKNLHFRVLLC